MEKKVVVITGATSGIGKDIATFLHSKDFVVYGTSRSPEKYDLPFSLFPLDLNSSESIQNFVKIFSEKEKRLDVLINNAGMGMIGAAESVNIEDVKNSFQTNFFGTVELTQKVLPIMRAQKSGKIITITSLAAYMGLPFRAYYSAAKSAITMFSESLSMEVKNFGIDVCTLAPGTFSTNIFNNRTVLKPEEEKVYNPTYEILLNNLDNNIKSGDSPVLISKKVYKIIQAKNPKLHYFIAKPREKQSIFIKKIVSSRKYEKMIMKFFKMKG